ncbi:hypothetical protein ACGFNU_38485 [Spirillospora sp. NPDC048911]|uniref:hypothetical protein n=1 Tax=Spirillospora sp. NPDC048911 TaxID=3364527 RepID=UPI003722A93C
MPHPHTGTTTTLTRAGLLVAVATIGLLGGLSYGALSPANYTADAHVLVTASANEATAATSFAQAYGRLATLPTTLALATPPLPRASLETARKHLQVSTSPDAPLIRLTGSAEKPAQAAAFANAAATALTQYGNAHRNDTGVRVVLMNTAAPPRLPSGPSLSVSALVGTAAGVLLAMLIAATGWDRRVRIARPPKLSRASRRPAGPEHPVERVASASASASPEAAHPVPARWRPARWTPARRSSGRWSPTRRTPVQPEPARPETVQPEPAQRTTAQPDTAQRIGAQTEPAERAGAQADLAPPPAPTRPDPEEEKPARASRAKRAPARSKATKPAAEKPAARKQPARKQPASAQPDPAQPDAAQPDAAQPKDAEDAAEAGAT